MIVRVFLIIVSFLLLGAHFLRAGNVVLAVGYPLIPLLLLIKTRWSIILVQLLTYFGVVIWIHTTIRIYQKRQVLGLPWGRAMIIMGAVTLFTLISGLLLNSSVVKEKYSDSHSRSRPE